MVIDVHCHVGLSARRVDSSIARFSFERNGAEGSAGYDSYLAPRMIGQIVWHVARRWLGIDPWLERGDALDAQIEAANERHWLGTAAFDRVVLLAFDEYHDDSGAAIGWAERRQRIGSDLYASNSYVAAMCRARPDRYLFGASVHPYRRGATEMVAEVVAGGAALLKWLPIHQNIRAEDPRTVEFLRAAGRLGIPMLIHYGGEMALARQHMEFEHVGPMLTVLRRLRAEGVMPPVIVAHVATPSFRWQSASDCLAFIEAMLGEFADAPLYADISGLAAFGRTHWLSKLAARRELHRKLLWGSDFPIPVMLSLFWHRVDRATRRRIAATTSWVEQDLMLKRALGFDECVFTQAADVLRMP